MTESVAALARAALKAAGIESSEMPERVPLPDIAAKGELDAADRWKSLMWGIDTAQLQGPDSLRGLTIALVRIIQAEALDVLLFDTRWFKKPALEPSDPFWDRTLPLTASGETLDQLMTPLESPITVELSDAAVFSYPWDRWRLHRALGNIGEGRAHGPWRQSENHYGIGLSPWPIVLLDNGNHSTLAGQLRGGGTLRCEESYDFTPVLRAVRTDGATWYRVDDGSSLGPVASVAMAGIFVVGQRLAGIGMDTPRP